MGCQVPSASTLTLRRGRAAVKAQDELADSALTAALPRPKRTYKRPKGPTEATAAKLKSVNHVPGTKCKPCIGLDISRARSGFVEQPQCLHSVVGRTSRSAWALQAPLVLPVRLAPRDAARPDQPATS
jgi:hypothetical protein